MFFIQYLATEGLYWETIQTAVCVCVCALTLPWELFGHLAQVGEAVGSQLAQNSRQHLGQLLGLSVARNGESVSRKWRLHFWVVEVDHCPIISYHVHLEADPQKNNNPTLGPSLVKDFLLSATQKNDK